MERLHQSNVGCFTMRAKQYCQKAKCDKVLEDKIQVAVKDVNNGTVPSAAAAQKHFKQMQYEVAWKQLSRLCFQQADSSYCAQLSTQSL